MRLSIGCDHGALNLKNQIVNYLKQKDFDVMDYGTFSQESCDYPDFAYKAALAVANGSADYGIVLCTTGIGVSIVANKVKGVRCALVDNVDFARLTREHNNANVLALGSKAVDIELAKQIIDTFLDTPFSNGERHIRRIMKIKAYEGE